MQVLNHEASRNYLEKAQLTPVSGEDDTRQRVARMLGEIEPGGEAKALAYAHELDGFTGELVLSAERILFGRVGIDLFAGPTQFVP